MDQKKISHDIQNSISRLKIMHDLAKENNFEMISKEELTKDLEETLQDLKENFKLLLQ
jgi:hypothetical protein